MTTTWKDELKNLGIDSDVEIAERLGVTKERVRQKRKQLNISRAPRQLGRPTREGGTNDIAELLPIVPLSVSDRQLLTDARVARGWSQTELAKRAGGSLTFINGIEMGKKSPSPQFLSRLCKALGLEWQCEFRVRIVKATKRSRSSRRR